MLDTARCGTPTPVCWTPPPRWPARATRARPPAGEWSAGQILAHVAIVTAVTIAV